MLHFSVCIRTSRRPTVSRKSEVVLRKDFMGKNKQREEDDLQDTDDESGERSPVCSLLPAHPFFHFMHFIYPRSRGTLLVFSIHSLRRRQEDIRATP